MVRLKVPFTGKHQRTDPPFQFHYGTIKSLLQSGKHDGILLISIPLWYD